MTDVSLYVHCNAALNSVERLCETRVPAFNLEVVRFRFLRIAIPKNRDSGSLAHFGGIGNGIGVKGIVKGIKKELFSNSQFLISRTSRRNRDSQFLILRNRAISSLIAAGRARLYKLNLSTEFCGHGIFCLSKHLAYNIKF